MALLSLDQIRDELPGNASIYPQNLDFAREAILFLRLDRAAFRAASFLDDRILSAQTQGRWVRFTEVAPWLANAVPMRPLHFIFHAGHVGSTLVSRLLDEIDGVLGLREPLPLRVLAAAHDELGAPSALASEEFFDTLLRWHLVLWSRGAADTQAVIVKATSSASRLCPPLLQALPTAKTLCLNLAPEPYLATLLAGENSYLDLRGHGPERFKRLTRLGAPPPLPLHAMSLGEIAALTWLVESLTQKQAATAFGARVLAIDFDAFLRAPDVALRSICAHFGLSAQDGLFAQIHDNPVLKHYSKAPDHPYTPQFRSEILAASRARNAEEIRKGLAWLDRLAREYPAVAAIVSA